MLHLVIPSGPLAVNHVTLLAREVEHPGVAVLIDRRTGRDRRTRASMREHGGRTGQRRRRHPLAFSVLVVPNAS